MCVLHCRRILSAGCERSDAVSCGAFQQCGGAVGSVVVCELLCGHILQHRQHGSDGVQHGHIQQPDRAGQLHQVLCGHVSAEHGCDGLRAVQHCRWLLHGGCERRDVVPGWAVLWQWRHLGAVGMRVLSGGLVLPHRLDDGELVQHRDVRSP